MADFEIERPSVDVQPIQPTYNINTPSFTIEINGSTPGQRGEQGPPGQDGRDGRDGVDGTNGIDGIDGQDGVSVTSIEQTTTSTESGGTNIITATLSNGDVSTFEIMNGLAGTGIKPLESPIIIQELEDGLYLIPSETDVYGVQENAGDIQFTTKGNAIISITHDLVSDAVDPDTKYDVASYYVIQDASVYVSESEFNITPTLNTTMLSGAVCDDTGDEWSFSEFSLSNLGNVLTKNDVIDNLTSSVTNKPLSAAQGKALKDLLDAIVIPTNTSDLNNDSGFITSSSLPTKVSDLSNDSGFITNTVNNLTNYYTKTNTYTKTEIDNLISAISTLDIEVVQALPTQDISTTTIYLVPKTPSTNDAYDEYIYVNNSWEHIGSTEVDLTNYYTKTQTDGLLNNKANTADVQNNKNLTRGIEYIVGTQESATNLWTGVSTDTGCSSGTIYTGKTIIYHLPVAGTSSAAKLNLTLPDGTTTGAINIYRLTNSTVTTTFGAGCDILMVFDGTQWKVNAYVDSNTNTIGYQLRTNSGIFKNGASTAIYRYQILVETPNGLEAFTSTSNSTKTTKTQLSPHYRPGGEIRYYGATGTVSSGANIGATSLWQQYAFDLRYSFNVTSTEFEIGDSIYIKMSKNGDGTLSPVYNAESAGHPLVTELPATEDGYVYLYLGQTYSAYQIELTPNHPMYEYKNGKIREYTEASSGGGGSSTDVQVNGTSITSGGVANLLTETAYNSSTNKIATMSDLPTVPTNISSFTNDSGYITSSSLPTKVSDLTNDSGFITSSYHDSTKQDLITSSNKLDYSLVDNTPTIPTVPTKVSDLTNDSNFISGLVMLTYDSSTWQDFIDAYNSNKIVYCKVGGRMAFLAYVEATRVEFQYYRSLSSPTVSSQPDEVYVYALTSANKWTTTTRKASSTIAVGTGLSRSYTASSRTMTLSVDTSKIAQKSDLPTKTSDLTNDSGFITGYTETDPVFAASAAHGITSTDITNWNNKSDFSGSYNDLTNKPTIPTVNNATLTIQKNGTTVKTFTANASSNVTANITVPTKTSDITNDSGYITGITSGDVTNALGYVPEAEANIYQLSRIRQITSASDETYLSLKNDVTYNKPIKIQGNLTIYNAIGAYSSASGLTIFLWFNDYNNSCTKISLISDGTDVETTIDTIEIPTKTSDLTNDSNFAVTNADNKFSVGQTISGETVVDSIRTKNMFDSSYINNKWVSYPSGSIVDAANANARRISCSSGDTFTLSATFGSNDSNNIIVMAFYNASGTLLNRYVASNSTTLTLTETAPSNTSYMYVGHYSNLPNTIQLEKGSTATTYAPYQNLTGQENYSTTETIIGTWIDGKPLYRKVVVKDNIGTSGNAGYAYAYIDTLTKMQFIAVTPNEATAGVGIIDGNFNNGTNKVVLQAYKINSSRDIDIWFDSTVSCTKLIITLEYTKTTD